MADVARLAKVSRSTVSRVYQPGASVPSDTQLAVREAARALGYVHNLVASELAGGTRSQLGLLIRDATNPAYGHLHAAIHREVERAGRHLVSVTASRHDYGVAEVAGLQRLIGLRVGGVLVATGVTAPEDLHAAAEAVPLMVVGRPNDDPALESVSYDELAHACLVVDRAHSLGHRRVGLLAAPLTYSRVFDLRVRGMRRRCRELGIAVHEIELLPVGEGVRRALAAARREGLTAILCPVDYVALELLRAAAVQDVRVPEDVSVAGFDGLTDGLELIGLTTVRLPVAELAQRAVGRMLELTSSQPRRAEEESPYRGAECGEQRDGRNAGRHELCSGELVPGRTLGGVE